MLNWYDFRGFKRCDPCVENALHWPQRIGLNELVSTTLGNLVCLPFLSAMSS